MARDMLIAGASRAFARAAYVAPANLFPLAIHESGKYFVSPDGSQFFMQGDTPWMIVNQCSNAQIDAYLDSVVAYGINAILIEAPGFLFTSQSPATNNADGDAPFTVMSPYSWVLNDTFWQRVDYLVNGAKARGIFVWMNPAYLGFGGEAGSGSGVEGCMAQITAASAGTLQTYGATLATRYTQGNVGWCLGGDYKGDTTERNKQANVLTGIRSVRTTDLVMAHPARGEDAYAYWGPGGQDYTGWNVGTTYAAKAGTDAATLGATAYARSGIPHILIEAGYYGEATDLEARRALWQSALSGCAGLLAGSAMWGFGCGVATQPSGGASSALSTWLGTAVFQQSLHMRTLLRAYPAYRLVPKTDSSLVSSAHGTGTGRIVAALASDGTYALIYSPSVNVTVVMMNFTQSTVRVRSMNPQTGAFTSVGSYANTGSQSITVSSESVLVFD